MKKYIFPTLLLISLSFGCDDFFESTLEVDPPPHTPQMTVHAFIMENDSAIGVSVGRTFGVLETVESYDEEYLDDATVEIHQNGSLKYQLKPFEELDPNPDIYLPLNYTLEIGDDIGGIGDSFEIVVTHPDFGTITSVQHMPAPVQVTSAIYEEDGGIGGEDGDQADIIDITFTDPPGVGQFYEIALAYYDEEQDIFYSYDTESLDPNLTRGENYHHLLTDLAIDGKEYTLRLELDESYDEHMHLVFRTVTEDWYLYSKSIHDFKEADDFGLFSEPVTVHSNVAGGLGIFAAGVEVLFPVTE